jgi:hypothetical protein
MFRTTGPGKVEVDRRYSSPGITKALLYNFDFDDMHSSLLKPDHRHFLAEWVLPPLAKNRGHIWMQGSASRIGAAGYNKTLSHARVSRVAAFLEGKGVAPQQMQLNAVGAELAAGHALDDERDRGVVVVVLPRAKVDPPPPPPVPPRPKVSQQFQLTLLAGVSAGKFLRVAKFLRFAKFLKGKIGAGVAGDVLFFQIWDTTNNLACIYAYVGVGLGVGFTFLPSQSATAHGPWNPFSTSSEISSAQFSGPARFTTAGIGSKSVNYFHLLGTPRGVRGVYMMINTGTTFGAGMSGTVGDFILLAGPDRFIGP